MADILCEDILNSKFFTEILIHHMERTALYILVKGKSTHKVTVWKEPENDRIKLTKDRSRLLKEI